MRRLFIPATVLALALTGCTPANAPAGTPAQPDASGATVATSAATAARSTTASAPPATTPAASPAPPSATSSAALAQEAEQVLREFQKEYDRASSAKEKVASAKMKELATGEFLKAFAALLAKKSSADVRISGSTTLRSVREIHPLNFPGAVLGLSVCQDGTKRVVTDAKGARHPGRILLLRAFFKKRGARLVLFDGESHEVKSCE